MAKVRTNTDLFSKMVISIIIFWLIALTYMGNLFGQMGLGALLIVSGIWTLARSKEVWNNYVMAWKKLPKNQKSEWNRPRRRYYYINLLILVPLSIGLGIALVTLSYFAGIHF